MNDETPTHDDAAPSPATPPETPPAEAPAPAASEAPAPVAAEAPEAPAAASPPPPPPAPTAAEAPTQPEVMAAAPAGPAYSGVSPAEPVVVAPAPSASHVAVPKWVLATVAAVVGAAVMFGVGYAVGDGSSNDNGFTAIGTPFNPNGNGSQQAPAFPGQGNGNGSQVPTFPGQGNGNGNTVPQSPNQPTSGAFLGVATQQTSDGLEIVQVVSGSAADDAGLEVGDVIVGFDGNDVTTPAQLANAVGNLDPGDEVDVRYVRDGDTRTVSVELGSRSTTNSN